MSCKNKILTILEFLLNLIDMNVNVNIRMIMQLHMSHLTGRERAASFFLPVQVW